MKFFLDQNISPKTTAFLRSLGLNVTDVRETGLIGKADEEIYAYALQNKYVLVTFDKDFGYRYMAQRNLEGLIILRIHPQTLERVHPILEEFFTMKAKEAKNIKGNLIVLENVRYRIRKIKNGHM